MLTFSATTAVKSEIMNIAEVFGEHTIETFVFDQFTELEAVDPTDILLYEVDPETQPLIVISNVVETISHWPISPDFRSGMNRMVG